MATEEHEGEGATSWFTHINPEAGMGASYLLKLVCGDLGAGWHSRLRSILMWLSALPS